MKISQEYVGAVVLLIGAILKAFGVEIENSALEGIVAGVIAVWIAVRRYKKGDISIFGAKR